MNLIGVFIAFTSVHITSYSTISYDNINYHEPLRIVREINGGTIINVDYSDDVPYEMQSAFDHACRLWEEAMPNNMPLYIKVSLKNFSGVSQNALSKTSARIFVDFGLASNANTYSSQLKHIILSEYESNVNHTFINYLNSPNEIDGSVPDMEITYNKKYFDQMSFSIADDSTDKYDFVTLALRDIAKGLGMTSSIRPDQNNTGSLAHMERMSPFERKIISAIGGIGKEGYANATKGEVELCEGFTLYAPKDWTVGLSLQTTVPSQKLGLSRLMDYRFGKGFVMRNFCDKELADIFTYQFDYCAAIPVGTGSGSTGCSGTTSVILPYIPSKKEVSTELPNYKLNRTTERYDDPEVYDFVSQYAAGVASDNTLMNNNNVQILKKDGTWDIVKYLDPVVYWENNWTQISKLRYDELDFHFQENMYARTADGYLRARLVCVSRSHVNSNYFLIDCLPQAVQLSAVKQDRLNDKTVDTPANIGIDTEIGTPIALSNKVRIGMKNLAGLTGLTMEVLAENSRFPVRFEVDDFKKGYFELDLEDASSATVTPISYNSNGSTRGKTITVYSPLLFTPSISYSKNQNGIKISVSQQYDESIEYDIYKFDTAERVLKGKINNNAVIETKSLSSGIYLLKCCLSQTVSEYKFVVQ